MKLEIGRQAITDGLRSLLRLPSSLVASVESEVGPYVLVGDTTVLPYDFGQQHFVGLLEEGGAGLLGVWMEINNARATGTCTVDAIDIIIPLGAAQLDFSMEIGTKEAGVAFNPTSQDIEAVLRNQPVGKVGFLDGVLVNHVPVRLRSWINEGATTPLIIERVFRWPNIDVSKLDLGDIRFSVPGLPITLSGNAGLYLRANRVVGAGNARMLAQFRGRYDSVAEPQTA